MEKQDIIKYVAIAAGAYLIYTFVRDQGYLDGLFGDKKTPAVDEAAAKAAKAKLEAEALEKSGATAAAIKAAQDKAALLEAELQRTKAEFDRMQATAMANSKKPVGVPSMPPPNPTTPTIAYTGNLSQRLSALLGAGRKQLNADAWNAYTAVVTGVPQTADLFDPGNRDALMSMSEYFDRRTAAGLDNETTFGMSGYSGYSGGMGNYSPWLT
jgi:hypothetical protein